MRVPGHGWSSVNVDLRDHATQIQALWEGSRCRVIDVLKDAVEDGCTSPGHAGAYGQRPAERLKPQPGRAGAKHQYPARAGRRGRCLSQHLHGFFGSLGSGSRGGELWRIAEHQIVAALRCGRCQCLARVSALDTHDGTELVQLDAT